MARVLCLQPRHARRGGRSSRIPPSGRRFSRSALSYRLRAFSFARKENAYEKSIRSRPLRGQGDRLISIEERTNAIRLLALSVGVLPRQKKPGQIPQQDP